MMIDEEHITKVISRRLNRAYRFMEKLKSSEDKLTKHGHWELGYYEGKISALEDILDMIEEDKICKADIPMGSTGGFYG